MDATAVQRADAISLEGRLYGLALHQLYRYFRFCPTDTPFIRTIVSHFLWSISLAQRLPGQYRNVSVRSPSLLRQETDTSGPRVLETLHSAFAIHAWYGRHRTGLHAYRLTTKQLLLPRLQLSRPARTAARCMVWLTYYDLARI